MAFSPLGNILLDYSKYFPACQLLLSGPFPSLLGFLPACPAARGCPLVHPGCPWFPGPWAIPGTWKTLFEIHRFEIYRYNIFRYSPDISENTWQRKGTSRQERTPDPVTAQMSGGLGDCNYVFPLINWEQAPWKPLFPVTNSGGREGKCCRLCLKLNLLVSPVDGWSPGTRRL